MKERDMIAERNARGAGHLAFGRAEVLEAAALKSETNCARDGPALLSFLRTRIPGGGVSRLSERHGWCWLFVARRVRMG